MPATHMYVCYSVLLIKKRNCIRQGAEMSKRKDKVLETNIISINKKIFNGIDIAVYNILK